MVAGYVVKLELESCHSYIIAIVVSTAALGI